MKAAVQARAYPERVVRFAIMAGLTLCALGAMALAAQGEDGTNGIETGSIERDVVVAPVRRVFPKTPTDRDLNRLSRPAKARSKNSRTAKTR